MKLSLGKLTCMCGLVHGTLTGSSSKWAMIVTGITPRAGEKQSRILTSNLGSQEGHSACHKI